MVFKSTLDSEWEEWEGSSLQTLKSFTKFVRKEVVIFKLNQTLRSIWYSNAKYNSIKVNSL